MILLRVANRRTFSEENFIICKMLIYLSEILLEIFSNKKTRI